MPSVITIQEQTDRDNQRYNRAEGQAYSYHGESEKMQMLVPEPCRKIDERAN